MRLLTESSAPIKVWMSTGAVAFAISDSSRFQENAARLSWTQHCRPKEAAFLGRQQFSFTFSPLNERLHSFTSCHDDAGRSQGFDSSFVSFFVKAKCFFPNLSSLQKITTVAVQVATHHTKPMCSWLVRIILTKMVRFIGTISDVIIILLLFRTTSPVCPPKWNATSSFTWIHAALWLQWGWNT